MAPLQTQNESVYDVIKTLRDMNFPKFHEGKFFMLTFLEGYCGC